MTELQWEEPPPALTGMATVEQQQDAIKQLREKPGQWAVVSVLGSAASAGQFAYTVRTGMRKLWAPAGSFEAVSRKVKGEHRVYARFVGEHSDE